MRVEVNKKVCIGCGNCTKVAPDVFDYSSDGFAKVIPKEHIPPILEDETLVAVISCPVTAILKI